MIDHAPNRRPLRVGVLLSICCLDDPDSTRTRRFAGLVIQALADTPRVTALLVYGDACGLDLPETERVRMVAGPADGAWSRTTARVGLGAVDCIERNPDAVDVLIIGDPFQNPAVGMVPAATDRSPLLVGLLTDVSRWLDRGPPGTEPLPQAWVSAIAHRHRYGLIVAETAAAAETASARLRIPRERLWTFADASESPGDRLLSAIDDAGQVGRRPPPRSRRRRPPGQLRLAFVSPLPPMKSGVADYAARLVRELSATYRIDLFHDGHYTPDLAWDPDHEAPRCYDLRLLSAMTASRDYRAIVYQMGNSIYHQGIYPLMRRHPGLTALHDLNLANLQCCLGRQIGNPAAYLAGELEQESPHLRDELMAAYRTDGDLDRFVARCAAAGAFMNRRVFEDSERVIVHSDWSRSRVPRGMEGKTFKIPLGAETRRLTADERRAIRARFGIPAEDWIVAAFGFVHVDKMNVEALDAFAQVADEFPRARLLFAGEEADGGATRSRLGQLAIGDRVQFLGRLAPTEFADLIAATDVGLGLRRPPTNGESSAALLQLLGSGVATIVTDVATFADFPDTVVRKVRWDGSGPEALTAALRGLLADPAERCRLGEAAREYVERRHGWKTVAAQYVEAIEAVRRIREACAA